MTARGLKSSRTCGKQVDIGSISREPAHGDQQLSLDEPSVVSPVSVSVATSIDATVWLTDGGISQDDGFAG